MAINYTLALDLNDDGDWVDANEAFTQQVTRMAWRLGMAAAYDSMAAPSWGRITVNNLDAAFSPEVAAAWQPGRRVRIQGDGVTLFVGIIDYIAPQGGALSPRAAVIHLCSMERALQQARIRLPPRLNVRANQVTQAILDVVPLRAPTLGLSWQLGVSGFGNLNSSARFGQPYPRSLETGRTLLAYVGDTWGQGISAWAALQQLVENERGRFYFARDGVATLLNRHHTLADNTLQATLANDAEAMTYRYGDDLVNLVSVQILPRAVGPANSVLWQQNSATEIIGARTLTAPFRDADDQPMGALSIIPPQPYTDYTINARADGTGADLTKFFSVVLRNADFSAATLEISNRGNLKGFLQSGARLRGTPLYSAPPLLVEQRDQVSINRHSLRALTLTLPLVSSVEDADQISRYELARRAQPRGVVSQITISNRSHPAHILARTLFDRVRVQDSHNNHSADYFIIAEQHTVDLGGWQHQAEWTLEPAAAHLFWQLDTSTMNTSTRLSY
jgi:hypothetical protein